MQRSDTLILNLREIVMTTSKKKAKKIKVTINDEDFFDAWTLEEEWNEWAVPYFEKPEADKVAKIHDCKYNPSTDSYEFEQDEEVEEFSGLMIETEEGSKKVYSIGGGSWIWDKKEDESEKVEDANGLEIQEGDTLVAAEDIEQGYVDGGRTPKVVYKKGEIVIAEGVFWDEPSQSGKVVIERQDFESFLFIKKI